MPDLIDEIKALKKSKNATILAHYYQEGDIQDLADFTGDSLKLARAATIVKTPIIVFCGVHFMAETAKMLNPEKTVLLPDLKAGCSLADSCPADKLRRYQEMLRESGRRFQTVTYINSSAAVKAWTRAVGCLAVIAAADTVLHRRRVPWLAIGVFDHPAHVATAGLVALYPKAPPAVRISDSETVRGG